MLVDAVWAAAVKRCSLEALAELVEVDPQVLRLRLHLLLARHLFRLLIHRLSGHLVSRHRRHTRTCHMHLATYVAITHIHTLANTLV